VAAPGDWSVWCWACICEGSRSLHPQGADDDRPIMASSAPRQAWAWNGFVQALETKGKRLLVVRVAYQKVLGFVSARTIKGRSTKRVRIKTSYHQGGPTRSRFRRQRRRHRQRPSTTQRGPTSSSSFHLITRVLNPQSRRKPEPTWKTLKMLRRKRGTRYPSTTGRTHLMTPPTPRTTTRSPPPTAPTTAHHDYISYDRIDGTTSFLNLH
jgi:hypothetical protein